jgi:hypothetical protein
VLKKLHLVEILSASARLQGIGGAVFQQERDA